MVLGKKIYSQFAYRKFLKQEQKKLGQEETMKIKERKTLV
jgi:hypothetical protein